jgi:hypothetical protein
VVAERLTDRRDVRVPSDGRRRLYQGRLYASPSFILASPLPVPSHSVALSHPFSTLSYCKRRKSADSIYNFGTLFLSFSFTLFGLSYKKFYKLPNFVFKTLFRYLFLEN